MRIPLTTIEAAVQKLLTFARGLQIEEVEVPVDYYWNLDDEDLYNMSASHETLTTSLGVGSLEADWERINKLISEGCDGDECNSVDYIIVASLLRAVGNYLYDSKVSLATTLADHDPRHSGHANHGQRD